jgi:hypothetical protein
MAAFTHRHDRFVGARGQDDLARPRLQRGERFLLARLLKERLGVLTRKKHDVRTPGRRREGSRDPARAQPDS